MYDQIKKELRSGTIFNFFLNEEGNFKLCEIVRLSSSSKFVFFDETTDDFEEILIELQNKINIADWEDFHYQELSKKRIKLYKEKSRYNYSYEDDINDYILKRASEKNFERLLSGIRYYLN